MKISREDVMRVAELANLDLAPAEAETFRGQLDAILRYVDKLGGLDVNGVEPMAQVLPRADASAPAAPSGDPHSALRADTLEPSEAAEAILAAAPEARKPFFRVPKVIER